MIQEPSISSSPVQLETSDPPEKDVPTDDWSDGLDVRTVVIPKGKLSADEIRLEEEALDNALIELDNLGKTAAQLVSERAEREERVSSKTEELRGSQNEPSEEAPSDSREEPAEVAVKTALPSKADLALAKLAEELDLPADIVRLLNSDATSERSLGLSELGKMGGKNAFPLITQAFDEESEDLRNSAARALFDLHPDRAATFARALSEASSERRRRIGSALATSGLAAVAISRLAGESRETGYTAFSLLFLMTKAGEVQPLLRAVEDHPNIEVRLTVVKLLSLHGQAAIVPSFRKLAVTAALPPEVRAAVIETIYELGRQLPRQLSSGVKRLGVEIK